jgi:hypothetical protein
MVAAAKPSTTGYQTTFWIHCSQTAAKPHELPNASFTQV